MLYDFFLLFQRASFKMAVEQNLREKYLHYNPKKPVDEMPKVTYLKRTEFKVINKISVNINIKCLFYKNSINYIFF